MLAVPLWVLYEVGIVLAGFITKPAQAQEDVDSAEAESSTADLEKADAEPKRP